MPVGKPPKPRVTFRLAEDADVEDVVAIVESAYRGDESRAGWTTEAHLIDGRRTDAAEVRSILHRTGSVIILAEVDGQVAGSCHLENRSQQTAYFGMFAVRPQHQGTGLGHSLLGEACRMASGWGCRNLRMTVIRQRDDLIAWYERRGFVPTGEREPFPYGDERFGRPRQADLDFLVLSGPIAPNGIPVGAGPTASDRSPIEEQA